MMGSDNSGRIDPLIRDMLEWIGPTPRPYRDVIEAWRTSCPRLTVWEDAIDLGLVRRRHSRGGGDVVEVTALGLRALDS